MMACASKFPVSAMSPRWNRTRIAPPAQPQKAVESPTHCASFCIGSRRLYDFLHDNALFEFRPIEYVADPEVVAKNFKMASLTQALVMDLTGQVCAD